MRIVSNGGGVGSRQALARHQALHRHAGAPEGHRGSAAGKGGASTAGAGCAGGEGEVAVNVYAAAVELWEPEFEEVMCHLPWWHEDKARPSLVHC